LTVKNGNRKEAAANSGFVAKGIISPGFPALPGRSFLLDHEAVAVYPKLSLENTARNAIEPDSKARPP
jgi:hypothetical protein